ncbi:hypothetical protein P5F73_00755 [Clostridium perfringens]|nr:hypothetical protein [Clostridium perfringens]
MENDLVISSRELSKEIARRLDEGNIVLLDTNDGSKIFIDNEVKALLKEYYNKNYGDYI